MVIGSSSSSYIYPWGYHIIMKMYSRGTKQKKFKNLGFRPYFVWHQGPLALPLDRNFGFSIFPCRYRVTVNQYMDFQAYTISGSVLDHISSGDRGPWLLP